MAIGLAASLLHAWRLAMLVPIVWVVALNGVRPRETGASD